MAHPKLFDSGEFELIRIGQSKRPTQAAQAEASAYSRELAKNS